MSGTHKRTTTQRGLGWRHKQQAAHLKRIHIDGTPCWWCGEPMYLTQGLSADHSIPRSSGGTIADRLLHTPCNEERGNGARDDRRPSVTGVPLRRVASQTDLGNRVMAWP